MGPRVPGRHRPDHRRSARRGGLDRHLPALRRGHGHHRAGRPPTGMPRLARGAHRGTCLFERTVAERRSERTAARCSRWPSSTSPNSAAPAPQTSTSGQGGQVAGVRRSRSRARSSSWSIRAKRSRRCSKGCRARWAIAARWSRCTTRARRAARHRRPRTCPTPWSSRSKSRWARPKARWSSPCARAFRCASTMRAPSHACARTRSGLLLEMEISSFAVVPLRSSSEQFGLATWQGRDVPAVGVVILSKDEHDHRRRHRAPDAVRHPGRRGAGARQRRRAAQGLERAARGRKGVAVLDGQRVRRSGRPDRREQRHHPAEPARRDAVQSQFRRQRRQAPRDLDEQLPVHGRAQHQQARTERGRPIERET